jgi:CheY-like chemotaxis protein
MTRLLVVDDEEALVRMIARLMKRHGFEVATATTGAAALEAATTWVPDVVLSDVRMPVMDGPTLLKNMRACGLSMPVVFLTGYASRSDETLMALGASAVLGKPIDPETLVELLGTLIAPK